MNWNRVEGHWKQRRGKALNYWGKLMSDELATVAGKRDQLVGILQEKYGVASEETKRQVDEYKKIVLQLKKSNSKLMKSQNSSGKKVKRKPMDVRRASKNRQTQT